MSISCFHTSSNEIIYNIGAYLMKLKYYLGMCPLHLVAIDHPSPKFKKKKKKEAL